MGILSEQRMSEERGVPEVLGVHGGAGGDDEVDVHTAERGERGRVPVLQESRDEANGKGTERHHGVCGQQTTAAQHQDGADGTVGQHWNILPLQGARWINPNQQQAIEERLRKIGYDKEVEFDEYAETYDFTAGLSETFQAVERTEKSF